MDSHHTGSDELVYVQTQNLILTIKGSPFHPLLYGSEFQEKESNFRIACDEDFDISLAGNPESISFQNLNNSFAGEYRHRPLFFEQQRYEIIIEGLNDHTIEF